LLPIASDPSRGASGFEAAAQSGDVALRRGAEAVQTLEQKAKTLLAQADAHGDLSSSLAIDDATANA
jgi:hypothetical protein